MHYESISCLAESCFINRDSVLIELYSPLSLSVYSLYHSLSFYLSLRIYIYIYIWIRKYIARFVVL